MAKQILDLPSRTSEVLFGLIMALTITGSLSAVTAGREEVRTMLYGAVGCNVAWGLIDAVMFAISRLIERGRSLHTVYAVRRSSDPHSARRIISEAFPPLLVPLLPDGALEQVRIGLQGLNDLPARPVLNKDDLLGALGVFLLVVVSTFPVVLPFMLMSRAAPAMRLSSGIAVAMLFICGYRLGRYSGGRGWWMGLTMAIVGSVLVAVTIILGG